MKLNYHISNNMIVPKESAVRILKNLLGLMCIVYMVTFLNKFMAVQQNAFSYYMN